MKSAPMFAILCAFPSVLLASPVQLHCLIVGTSRNGVEVYPRTIQDVEETVAAVNRIYTQGGISFQIASVNVTNYENQSEFNANDEAQLRHLCSIMQNTCGLELYFVQRLQGALGVWTQEGIVISGEANFRTVAHEIGHAFGWPDIYVDRPGTFRTVQGAPTESRMPQDHGFFPDGTLQSDIVRRLLMYGVGSETKGRIPRGAVDGIWIPPAESPGGPRYIRFGLVPVGMFDVENFQPRSL